MTPESILDTYWRYQHRKKVVVDEKKKIVPKKKSPIFYFMGPYLLPKPRETHTTRKMIFMLKKVCGSS